MISRFLRLYLCILVVFVVPVLGGALGIAINTSDFLPAAGKPLTFTVSDFPRRSSPLSYTFVLVDEKGALVANSSNMTGVFDWIPPVEGNYELRIAVLDSATGEDASAAVPLSVGTPSGELPAIFPTRHPLVVSFAATCDRGEMRAVFRPVKDGLQQTQATHFENCAPGQTLTFLIAGLLGDTDYEVQSELRAGTVTTTGPARTFTTGSLPSDLVIPPLAVLSQRTVATSLTEPVILQGYVGPALSVAYDLTGRPIWYYPGALLARPVGGESMLVLAADASAVREVDLAGNTLRELTIREASRQLAKLDYPPIIGLHHDAIRLPNGYTAVLCTIEQLADQGSGIEDVNGDGILVLNRDWDIVWAWNPFVKLDLKRKAVLGEHCSGPCANLLPVANDWTHANSLQLTEDGNLLLSMRSLDWVVKIDYRNGSGTGDVIWRLGADGDFRAIAEDVYPWFSHQHMATLTGTSFLVFDNGNTRVAKTGGGNSRGQVWQIDEKARTATLDLNVDLGTYSFALGSAERLDNGNYEFLSGAIRAGSGFRAEALEVVPGTSGAVRKDFRVGASGMTYRTFRMTDLYTP